MNESQPDSNRERTNDDDAPLLGKNDKKGAWNNGRVYYAPL